MRLQGGPRQGECGLALSLSRRRSVEEGPGPEAGQMAAAATAQSTCLHGASSTSAAALRRSLSSRVSGGRVAFPFGEVLDKRGSGYWSCGLSCEGVRCSTSSAVEETTDRSSSASRVPRRVGRGSKLVGCGSAVPSNVISNSDLSKFVETSDEWISSRTGIRNRRVLGENESLTTLAVESARKALEMGNVKPEEVDLVILCTSTPEDLFGGACQIQRDLGCTKALAFDLTAACSGFVLGVVTGTRYIKGGGFDNVLVIGADALSRYVDWTDRGTCILFGDASGALLLQVANDDTDSLLGFDLRSDGNGQKKLHVQLETTHSNRAAANGAATNGSATTTLPGRASYSCIQMNGQEVFKFAVRSVPQVVEGALLEAGMTSENIDWLLLHQANQRILDSVADRLGISSDRVISNLCDYGNTSAASIPLALDEAVRSGRVKPGHVVCTAGFGAGLTWGSAIVRWG